MPADVFGFVTPKLAVCPKGHMTPALMTAEPSLVAHVEPCPVPGCGRAAIWKRDRGPIDLKRRP